MIKDFIKKEDLPLFTSGSRFSLASVFLKEKMDHTIATFDLLIRELPSTRNFFVFAGLEHISEYLLNLNFNKQQLDWLKNSFDLSSDEIKYFRNFKFSGDVLAMPEGTLAFPNEPIIRITAPIIEAQIIEMFLINTVYLQTILASKISRFVHAANGKAVAIGFNRSYGMDAAMKSARINEIFGNTNSLALYHHKHDSNPFGAGTFHYLIMAYEKEINAFRAYLKHMKGKGFVLIDTYDSIQGIKNFIKAAKELEKFGIKATGIQLDSGDLYKLSLLARKMLNDAELSYVKIMAMSNLDEWKVAELEKKHAPIDIYAGVTELLAPTDAPTIELVYKLCELRSNKKIYPKMKTATKKISLPGRKQVFRSSQNGKYTEDIIGLENEKLRGKKLLVPIIKKGKLVYHYPSSEQIRNYYREESKKFNNAIFSINRNIKYSVKISPSLNALAKKTRDGIKSVRQD